MKSLCTYMVLDRTFCNIGELIWIMRVKSFQKHVSFYIPICLLQLCPTCWDMLEYICCRYKKNVLWYRDDAWIQTSLHLEHILEIHYTSTHACKSNHVLCSRNIGGGEIAKSLASLSTKRAVRVCACLNPLVTERWNSLFY